MHLIGLPGDALRAIAIALLAEYEDERGYVRFSPAACSQVHSVSAVHPRLRAAIASVLDSVAYEEGSPRHTGEQGALMLAHIPQVTWYSALPQPVNGISVEQEHSLVSFGCPSTFHAIAANARRVALYSTAPQSLPSGLRELRIETPSITDAVCATLITANACTLRRLSLVQCNFGPIAAGVQCAVLEGLELHRVPGVKPRTLRRMLTQFSTTLRDMDIEQPYPVAPHVADKCSTLARLMLGCSDTIEQALERAVVANAASLEELVFRGRRADGDAVLHEQTLNALLPRCVALKTLDVGPLSARFVANTSSTSFGSGLGSVRRWRCTTLYIRATTECSLLHRAQVRTRALEWEHAPALVTNGALSLVHSSLRSLVLRAIPDCTDSVLSTIGLRTGLLLQIRLEQLPDVTCAGVEALLRPNHNVREFGVGAKCRKLSNVGIMSVLARHARALRVATFPRWSCAAAYAATPGSGAAVDPHLAAALAKFRAAVPHARVRSE